MLENFYIFGQWKIGQNTLVEHAFYSLLRVMAGYALGSVVGVILGLAMGTYKMVEAICSPLFRIIRPIPPIAWIPISIIWIGLGRMPKYFSFFWPPSAMSPSTPGTESKCGSAVGGCGPYAGRQGSSDLYHYYSAGLRTVHLCRLQVALSSSWATVLAAEMVRSSNGLGWVIIAGMNNNDMLQILVGIVAIGIVGLVLSIIFRKVEAVLCRWNKSGT